MPRLPTRSRRNYLVAPSSSRVGQRFAASPAGSAPEIAGQIETLTLATIYLQRLWSIRLALALGRISNFPELPFAYLWESKHLPPPSSHNGMCRLTALQEYEQKRTGLPFTFIGDWQNQVDQLLWQEENRHHPPMKNLLPLLTLLKETQEGEEE